MILHLTQTGGAIGAGSIVTILVAIMNWKTAKANADADADADAANRDGPAAPRKRPRGRRK